MASTPESDARSFLVLLTGEVDGCRIATFRVVDAQDHADAKGLAIAAIRDAPEMVAFVAAHKVAPPVIEVNQIVELMPLPSYWRQSPEYAERPAPRKAWWRFWRR